MDAILVVCPQCNRRLPDVSQYPLICSCGAHIGQDCKIITVKPPRWVSVVVRISRPQDIGIGATVKRIAALVGGESFKRWATRLGIPCGCADREQEWNRLYPNPNYRPPNA